MPLIKTEMQSLLRDTSSKAIIISDDRAREEYKKKRQEIQKIESMFVDIQNLKDCVSDIDGIRNDILEIKQLILSIKNNKAE